MMLPQEIIRLKRDGQELSALDIDQFVRGITDGTVSEGQIAAFGMAVFFNGMNSEEAVALTLSMQASGETLSWPDLDGPVVDKHSTGGVGDNVSLMLAPIIAACGGYVPMISGRGLGHTGGTLDKMDAIPGYNTQPNRALFNKVVRDCGCAIISADADLAPADKRFYAVRDVTATVESIPLITASILSKKLASGLQGLVLDVKTGNGAFMARHEDALALARSLVDVANGAGLPTRALITDMNQPLASAAGNSVEVRNAVTFLTGAHQDPRLLEVVLGLAGEMLATAKLAQNTDEGVRIAQAALDSGGAAEKFAQMVAGLGGPVDFTECFDDYLPRTELVRPVPARRSGYVGKIDTRTIGLSVVGLGGGRSRPQDIIDPAVGLTDLMPLSRWVEEGEPLAMVHARDEASFGAAAHLLQQSYLLQEYEPVSNPVIYQVLGE